MEVGTVLRFRHGRSAWRRYVVLERLPGNRHVLLGLTNQEIYPNYGGDPSFNSIDPDGLRDDEAVLFTKAMMRRDLFPEHVFY
jgi:hypothetical protein